MSATVQIDSTSRPPRIIREWLPLVLSAVAISFTAAQYYMHDYPRPGLLLQSLPAFGMFARADLDPHRLRFTLVNSGNRDVLLASVRVVVAKPKDTEWTDRLDLPDVAEPLLLKPGEMRLVNVDIPPQLSNSHAREALGPWLGLKTVTIIPSGAQFVTQFPIVAFELPGMPSGAYRNAVFCPQQISLLRDANVMPSHRGACRS